MITDEQAIDLGRLAAIVRSKPTIANRYDDAANKLAREVLEMLALRKAERELPIDPDWLESVGHSWTRGKLFDSLAAWKGGAK